MCSSDLTLRIQNTSISPTQRGSSFQVGLDHLQDGSSDISELCGSLVMSHPLQAVSPILGHTNGPPYSCPHPLHIEEWRTRSEQILLGSEGLVVQLQIGEKWCMIGTVILTAESMVDLGLDLVARYSQLEVGVPSTFFLAFASVCFLDFSAA